MDCCDKNNQKSQKNEEGKNKGKIFSGVFYGLMPHLGCIGFIVFSTLGVTTATAIFKPLLLNRYFFHILILISFIFATISALVYLKKNGALSLFGIKRKKGYLLTLYGITIGINLFLFMFVFPIIANIDAGTSFAAAISGAFFARNNIQVEEGENFLSMKVDILCPGHASLITGEIRKIIGVKTVKFKFPNSFDVSYSSEKTSKEQILSLEVFDIYKATITNEQQENNIKQCINNFGASQLLTDNCAGACEGLSGGCGCGCRR